MFAKGMDAKIKNILGGIVNVLDSTFIMGGHNREMNYSST